MTKYYFIGCSLPDIALGTPPALSFETLMILISLNLSQKDMEKTVVFRNFIDLKNLRAMWMDRSIDSRGNLNKKEIEEALLVHSRFSNYVFDFLDDHQDIAYRLQHFPYLIAEFFKEEVAPNGSFLHKFLTFEREVRLVLTALRAKQMKRDVLIELQYEDPKDDLVAYILAQKDADTFEPPREYEELKNIFSKYNADPKEIHRKLLLYRFNAIEDMVEGKPFTIDEIIAYMAKLIMVEDWEKLDKNKGKKIIDSLI
jgi:hypothetical protein